jgi:hypothetical protein
VDVGRVANLWRLPLAGMERVVLMERLSMSFSGGVETQGPPVWHDANLESRKGEWAD